MNSLLENHSFYFNDLVLCSADKTVFGVPLLLSLQRCGQALPPAIQKALRWLRANALDQVGIFRKSGVRSRIQRLKTAVETQGEEVSFEGQQAYDVADMVKQFFRELPEALLTNKLSETFISIFQRKLFILIILFLKIAVYFHLF